MSETIGSTGGVFNGILVIRSNVEPKNNYQDYIGYLRFDFLYCCAYCTIAESEAKAINFCIDHYEPKSIRADLVNDYQNLMYCCSTCNNRKGGRSPSESARASGVRFLRPDQDDFSDHIDLSGERCNPLTAAGDFTIEALDLNRLQLRRLRQIRSRQSECLEWIRGGFRELKKLKFDRLPQHLRADAITLVKKAERLLQDEAEKIEELLRENAMSPFIGPKAGDDPDRDLRLKKLDDYKVMYPGQWSSRTATK